MGGLFASKAAPIIQQTAPTVVPEVKPPAPMPDQNSAGALEARRKAQMDVMNRSGRSSTILTPPKTAAGSDYSGSKLGTTA